MHGKTDRIMHDGQGLFAGLPNPLIATRYHSLVIRPDTLNPEFIVSAWADAPDGTKEIMAIRHKSRPIVGVQFHPESFLTEHGHDMLRAFLAMRI
jgi:anthranilate synthase component 2